MNNTNITLVFSQHPIHIMSKKNMIKGIFMEYFIEVEEGVQLYVLDLNPEVEDQETIVFLHGWPLNHLAFEYQYNVLPYRNIRCIGIDMRGFGRSSKPIDGYTYDQMADDLHAVMVALDLDNVVLGGHSMGGAIAVRYMARYNQERVKKLALFAAAVPSLVRRPNFEFGLSEESITDFISQTYKNRPEMLVNFSSMFFFQFITQSITNWFIDLGLVAAGHSTALGAVALRDETTFADLPSITVPTIIMHGVHDKVALYSLGVYCSQHIQNARLVPFELSGHELFYEEKEKFNNTLIEFITQEDVGNKPINNITASNGVQEL